MSAIQRSFRIPVQGNQMPRSGVIQANVIQWLGVSAAPDALVLAALVAEDAPSPKSGLILPGARPDPKANRWMIHIGTDGEAPPPDLPVRQLGPMTGEYSYGKLSAAFIGASAISGGCVYVWVMMDPASAGVEVVAEAAE